MIDMSTEELVLLKKAAKLFPNRPHLATLYRYADGKLVQPKAGGDRVLVRLDTIVVGGIRYTSREAVQRFAESETAARDGEPAAIPMRANRQRQRDVSEAKKRLAAAGI